MYNKPKEELLEFDDTTDDTRISDIEYKFMSSNTTKTSTYNNITNINYLINKKDNMTENKILSQRENRRIIIMIKKELQKGEDKNLIKMNIKEILNSYDKDILLLRDDKKNSLLHIYVEANDYFATKIILEIYKEILGISEKFFYFLILRNIKELTAIELSVKLELFPIIKLLYQQIENSELYYDLYEYMNYLKNNIFNIAAEINSINSIIFFYEKLNYFYGFNRVNLLDNKEQNKKKLGMTPILYASKNKNLKLLNILLDLGANINSQDNKGFTSLHYAVMNNDERMVKHLLIRGADKFIKDKNNRNPYNLAVELNHHNIMNLLVHKNICRKIFCGGEIGKLSGKRSMILFIICLLFFIIIKILLFLRFYFVLNGFEFNINFFSYNGNDHSFGTIFKDKNQFEFNDVLNCFEKNCYTEIISFFIFLIVDIILLIDFIYIKCSKKVYNHILRNYDSLYDLYEKNPNICIKCRTPKSPTTKHCLICNRCVDNWDHHCYWLNLCINNKNFCKFKTFLSISFLFLISNLLFYIDSVYLILSSKDSFFPEIFNIDKDTTLYYIVLIIILIIEFAFIIAIIYLVIFLVFPLLKYYCKKKIEIKEEKIDLDALIDNDNKNSING